MATSPQRKAANIAEFLQQRARSSGWQTAKTEIRLDGTVLIEVSMGQGDSDDDFLDADLRVGK
jgi:hypothetical protein